MLRRQGIDAARWIVLWIVGLPLGMVVFVAVVGAARFVTGAWPPWPLEIVLYGVFIGGTARAVSGKGLLSRIEPEDSSSVSARADLGGPIEASPEA